MPTRFSRLNLGIFAIAITGACDGDGGRAPVEPPPLPVATTLTITGGDKQVGEAALLLPLPLSVRATDDRARPVGGARIIWFADGTGSLSAPLSVTDDSGNASVRRGIGAMAGAYSTTATLESNPAVKVTFTAVGLVNGASTLKKHPAGSGDGQSDTVGALLRPYRVLVANHEGVPVPGIKVRWIAPYGTLSSDTSRTDANGVAVFTHALSFNIGNEQVTARVEGLIGSPVFFVSTVWPGKPARLRIGTGDDQIGVAGERLADYVVHTFDAYGNAVSTPIKWDVVSGGGRIIELLPQRVAHVLGPEDGPQTVTATAVEMPGSPAVTFTARAVSALVRLGDFYCYGTPSFAPEHLTVPVGRTVAWLWLARWYGCENGHNITFEDAPTQPASSPTQETGSHLRTFTKAGTYRFRCTRHSLDFTQGMVGKVTVTEN